MITIQALGECPDGMFLCRDLRITMSSQEQLLPLFAVDAALFFPGTDEGIKKMLLRSGRPAIDFTDQPFIPDLLYKDYLTYLQKQPRSNYQPIDCNFYDNFEAAIVQRRAVKLEYLDADGNPLMNTTLLKDLKTHRTEEFVQLASGEWLRLDRIVSVDGIEAGARCRF